MYCYTDNMKDHPQYPDDAVVLALAVIKNGGSIRDACHAVGTQFDRRPDVHTVWNWAQRSEEAFSKVRPEKRREWELLAGQVYEAWAHRALEAAEAKDEHGNYVVSHAQSMVPYGIAKDGLRSVLDTVNPKGFGGNQFNVQFRLISRSQDEAEKRAEAGGNGEVIEGEAREIPAGE